MFQPRRCGRSIPGGLLSGLLLLVVLTLRPLHGEETSRLVFPLLAQERLLEAIRADDLEGAREALADGATVKAGASTPLAGFSPPLAEAIRHADLAMVELLVRQGVPVRGDTCDRADAPYALQAYFAGRTDVGNYLDAQPGGAVDPLVRAAANGEVNAFAKLEPEVRRKAPYDVLRAAAAANQMAVLKVLRPDKATRLRLFADAAAAGALGTMAYLLEGGLSLDAAGSKALEQAARADRAEVVAFLLEKGVPPNGTKDDGAPLSVACTSGSREAATRLLEAGADVNGRGDQGMQPLRDAVFRNDVELVRVLLKHGAKWDQPDPQQMTPLLLAASTHSPGSLALCLEHGADLNATHPTLGNLLSLAQRMIGEDSAYLTRLHHPPPQLSTDARHRAAHSRPSAAVA